jgi:hypothetical protein
LVQSLWIIYNGLLQKVNRKVRKGNAMNAKLCELCETLCVAVKKATTLFYIQIAQKTKKSSRF